MSEKQPLLESVANTIADYREGEIVKPTPQHVEKWVSQFHTDVQVPLLMELDHVLKHTYFERATVNKFLGRLVQNDNLTGGSHCEFWKSANFLNIQQNGQSQREMLQLFDETLQSHCGLKIEDCGSAEGLYIYLDDAIFSGRRVGNDLSKWIKEAAPSLGKVHVIVLATHMGQWQVEKRLREEAKAKNKNITFTWWRAITIENRKTYRKNAEVLWPMSLPEDEQLHAYLNLPDEHKFPFEPRPGGGVFEHKIFSSEEGRNLLEQELLIAGVKIRSLCQNPSRSVRPLGFNAFGLGFGSTIVTFRNCPNNCPLALWWGNPELGTYNPLSQWYPLFPRKTYDQDLESQWIDLDEITF